MAHRTVVTTKPFTKQLRRLPKKVQLVFRDRLVLFLEDETNAVLRVHKLTGEFTGLKSFNVTGDVRVIFDDRQDVIVVLIAIGTHSQLY